ncbi:MAG: hypothetical protein ACFCAD_23675 [Pleurocapsa sp.]
MLLLKNITQKISSDLLILLNIVIMKQIYKYSGFHIHEVQFDVLVLANGQLRHTLQIQELLYPKTYHLGGSG